MLSLAHILLTLCLLLATSGVAAAAGEPDISGLWRGSLYGSDLQARVDQDGHNVKAEVVVRALTGETNIYHVVGAVIRGHLYVLHGSGHVFEGDARGDEIVGVLTTKGGSRIELRATKVPAAPAGQDTPQRDAGRASRQPG